MTGPDGITAVILTAFAFLIVTHQRQIKHRSTTRQQQNRRTEHSHGQDQQPEQSDHRTSEEDGRKEDHQRIPGAPQDGR